MEVTIQHFCLILQICGIFHIGRSQKECEVQVLSDEVFVPFGERAVVNCTHTCSSAYWETRLRKNNTKIGTNWVSTEVLVNDWEKSLTACTHLTRSNILKVSTARVMAYALPRLVTIDLQGELEEWKTHHVNCTVHDVAPVQYLVVSVVKGGKVIHSLAFKEDLRKGLQTVTETFEFMVSRRDNLQDFTCKAALQLGTELEKIVESSSVTIRTYGQPEVPSITVTPSSRIKEEGSFTLACHSDGSPDPKFYWTVPPSAVVTYSQDNSTVNIAKANSQHNGIYQCEARNVHGRTRSEQVIEITQANGGSRASLTALLFFVAALVTISIM